MVEKDWRRKQMSRMGMKIDPKKRLAELEDLYSDVKTIEASIKKDVKKYGDEIKKLMLENELTDFGSMSISITPKEELNELQAIEVLRKELPSDVFSTIVKTKEYLDDDALEKYAYNSDFSMELLSSCIEKKPDVVTLRLGKKK